MKKLLPLLAVVVLAVLACTKKEENNVQQIIQQTTTGGGSTNKRVFVTFDFYSGNLLAQVSGAATGLAAADSLCTGAASRAGLGGTYKAWLSAPGTNAIDRISDVGPWYLTDDTPIFTSKARIITSGSGGSASGIIRTEYGTAANANQEVWTATTSSGTISPGNACSGWTSAGASNVGYGTADEPISTAALWTFTGSLTNCTVPRPFYCFEQ